MTASRRPLVPAGRVAAAPISWGVCEVPGWGHQMDPARVLREMAGLGITAAEFGPDGFLPAEPAARAATLGRYGLRPVGGFVPVVLHDADHDPLPGLRTAADAFAACGATTLVLAAVTGQDGYDVRPVLDADQWSTLLSRLDAVVPLARERGLTAALHPHVGTVVETRAEVRRVLEGSVVPLCLDTGHLLVGGVDPVELARREAGRVAHVHLKDVDPDLAADVRAGRLSYTRAVARGLYRPLGQGGVDVAALVRSLEARGYDGWYVMEQDAVLVQEPPPDAGPRHDVRACLDFLTTTRTGRRAAPEKRTDA
ncbi:TIM barrel protein [Streptomyces sp. ODS05-4]|uniref:TIM barrel protein n=1 Tax=Streptomyces sp. ODS05-4 TaxID=2944939 RepID=UPI00210B9BBE|nr:TIM barrel protein [Streptomyces sp. ODS05-4]